MITESIKTLLGEDLAAQVDTALKGRGKDGKDVDLVVGNDGSFVPVDKYDGEKRRANAAETALKNAADAVKELGGSGDPAKLADDAKTAKEAIDALKSNNKTEIAKIRKETALRMALADQVHDPADVMGRLDMGKIEVAEDGSLKTDLTEMLKPIQESKPYLFKEKSPAEPPAQPPIKGALPAPPAPGTPPKQYTMEELSKLSMDEYAAYRAQQAGFPKN
ncbi:Phage minor structural protein GP20 [anaerobic digester metagenome]